MSDRFIIANSSLLGLPAGIVAKMLRSPSARSSLVQRLASIMQSRQNLSGENRLSADQIIDANACEKRSCVTCPVGVQAL